MYNTNTSGLPFNDFCARKNSCILRLWNLIRLEIGRMWTTPHLLGCCSSISAECFKRVLTQLIWAACMVTVIQLAFVGLERFPGGHGPVCVSFYDELLTPGGGRRETRVGVFCLSQGARGQWSNDYGKQQMTTPRPLSSPFQHASPASCTKRLRCQADEELRDILGNLLEKRPEQRLTVTEARAHSWICLRRNYKHGGFNGYIPMVDGEDVVRGAAEAHKNGPGDL